MKPKYMALGPYNQLLFNSRSRNNDNMFPSLEAIKKAIKVELDEPIAESIAISYPGRRRTYTLRDDGFKESDFKIFVSVEGK